MCKSLNDIVNIVRSISARNTMSDVVCGTCATPNYVTYVCPVLQKDYQE